MKQEDERLQLAILRLKRPAREAVCRLNTGLEPKRACCAGAARLQRKDFLHGRCSIQSAVHSVATCSHQGQRSFLITARELWGISDVEGWYCPKCRQLQWGNPCPSGCLQAMESCQAQGVYALRTRFSGCDSSALFSSHSKQRAARSRVDQGQSPPIGVAVLVMAVFTREP